MFGVVRKHAAAEQEVEAINIGKQSAGATRREPLIWEAKGITDGRTDQAAGKSAFIRHGVRDSLTQFSLSLS
jgi:hypothetical protein